MRGHELNLPQDLPGGGGRGGGGRVLEGEGKVLERGGEDGGGDLEGRR